MDECTIHVFLDVTYAPTDSSLRAPADTVTCNFVNLTQDTAVRPIETQMIIKKKLAPFCFLLLTPERKDSSYRRQNFLSDTARLSVRRLRLLSCQGRQL